MWWGAPYPAYSDVVVVAESGDVDGVTQAVMAALRDGGFVPKGREVDVLSRVRAAVASATM